MSNVYFDERMETLPPDVLRKVQDHRLRWQFKRCWDGSPFYRARFEAAGLTPETFDGLADLAKLPLFTETERLETRDSEWRVVPFDGNLRARTWTDSGHESQRIKRARSAQTGPRLLTLDHYFIGASLAYSCGQSEGRHWVADQLLAEIIDVRTREPVAAGSPGELVVTDLVREGSPLIRFATGRVRALTEEPCPCGRTGPLIWTRTAYRKRRFS